MRPAVRTHGRRCVCYGGLARSRSTGLFPAGTALRESGRYKEALAEYDHALTLTAKQDPAYLDLATQRCETRLRRGDYERVIADAQEILEGLAGQSCLSIPPLLCPDGFGDVNEAQEVFQKIVRSAPTARNEFWFWATKYVFDTLEAGRSWYRPGREPRGAPSYR